MVRPQTKMSHPISIVQGGQYGSEAKGAIAAYLCQRDNVDFAVRTGATNAGHTVTYQGVRVAMQQLPCGWVNPTTILVIGAGALIDVDILKREIALINSLMPGSDVRSRLIIDPRAHIHRTVHKDRSTSSGRHYTMGATGKGCSEALMDRIRLRGVEDWSFQRYATYHDSSLQDLSVRDTEQLLNHGFDQGARIQLEGTQGQLLDLYLGPYPYTTHKQTGPAQWMLECGLSPALPAEVTLVVRTFPIRVAGNSGPLPLETSWVTLAGDINDKRLKAGLPPIVDQGALDEFEAAVTTVARMFALPPGSNGLDQHMWGAVDRTRYRSALSDLHRVALDTLEPETITELRKLFEMTTVTKKLRRIAARSDFDLDIAARQARPANVAVTFLNYVFPERWFTDDPVTDAELDYLSDIEEACGAPVTIVNRGPDPSHIVPVTQFRVGNITAHRDKGVIRTYA